VMDAAALPESWCVATLNDIAQPFGGSTPSKSDASFWTDGTVPWVSPKDMKVFELRGSEDLVSEKALARLSLIPEDSILVVVRSGILSRILPVAINHLPVTINQDMRAFVPAPEISARFIAWQLLANQREILAKCSKDGTTVASVEAVALATFPLALPPAAEQHRIVAKIEGLFSELDQGVASLKTAREQIKVYRQSLLKNAFEGKLTAAWRAAHRDQLETATALQQRIARERQARYQQQLADWQAAGQPGPKPKPPKPLPPLTSEELAELPELPAGWGWVKYGDLCSLVRNGISAKPEGDSGTPIFRISAVRPMCFDMADIRYIDNSNGAFDSYCLERGDIVFTRYNGSRQYVGVCAEYRADEKRLFPDKLVQTRVFSKLLLTSFLEKALNSGASRAFVESKIRTTAGQSGVSGEDIKNIPVPVCCLEEQFEIVQELESKLSEADQLDQTLATALQQAAALRQSILKKAFHGQLEKQDKNEEPATALLERIRAGKSNGMDTPRNRRKLG
jgi:type I restriction enzyme, S subunit